MYGDFVLIETTVGIEKVGRAFLGSVKGRDEAWLRDVLLSHPDIIPVHEIDPAFGPLIPLCRELRTEGGRRIDAVFVNERGRLTIVECKLWKNPEARREVVSQTLDYVSTLSKWSYADLQREVSAALGHRKGNVPYEIVSDHTGNRIDEAAFVDSVSRTLRDGRIMVLIAGDGIREGVQSLTQLVNRSATSAFTLGLLEVALYVFDDERLLVQPRVLAKTTTIERQVTIINVQGPGSYTITAADGDEPDDQPDGDSATGKEHLKAWWEPVLKMKFDDPEQEPPFWTGSNNAVLATPFPGIRIKAFASVKGGMEAGVFVAGTGTDNVEKIRDFIEREKDTLRRLLPVDTQIDSTGLYPIDLRMEFTSDDQRRTWVMRTLNEFVNVLRPRLRDWHAELDR